MFQPVPLQFGIPGGPEILIILLIAVLLFGANKIPKLARSTGEAMGEFQKGREQVEQELQDMREGVTGEGDDTDAEPAVESEPATDTSTDADVGDTDVDTVEADSDTEDDAESELVTDAESDADDGAETEDDEFEIADAESDDAAGADAESELETDAEVEETN